MSGMPEEQSAEIAPLSLNPADEFEAACRALADTEFLLEHTERELYEVITSTSWRYVTWPRFALDLVKYAIRRNGPRPTRDRRHIELASPEQRVYARWIRYFENVGQFRGLIEDQVDRLPRRPRFSIVLPVFNTEETFLRSAIESVRKQIYPEWQLCIADDASTEPRVQAILAEYASLDDRIQIVRRDSNGHISAATNSALSIASSDWIAFLDHDDLLPIHALALMALAIAQHPNAEMLYSDEDKFDEVVGRHDPYFKPDFDPLLLAGQNYLTHFLVVRRELIIQVGGLRSEFDGAQDWDLVLRLTDVVSPENVVHVPQILYHWRSHSRSTASSIASKDYASSAGRRAVSEHVKKSDGGAEVTTIVPTGHVRVRWHLPDDKPLVSVVVPTRDGPYLEACLDGLLNATNYPRLEVLIVDNGSQDPRTREMLASLDSRHGFVIRDERSFNFSALNNLAVSRANGDLVCLLNDDTKIVSSDWLQEMVGQILRPGVGAVGAKLYYEDGRIQHAGVVLGIGGVAGHAYRFWPGDSAGYMGRLLLPQRFSAVTAACMLVRRSAWQQVNGFDETIAVAFNDVDFCLRLGEAGWQIVWTPYAELTHYESVSRGTEEGRAAEFTAEVDYMRQRWASSLSHDPTYNPNLTLVREDWSLGWPPRELYWAKWKGFSPVPEAGP